MDFNSQKNPSNSSSSSPSKLVLYSFWQSSCSWRVRFGLNVKGLSYEYKSVNLAQGEQFSPEFERLNPLRLVPVLVDGDLVVSDSYAILLYLEEKYPEKALLPLDPQLKAVNLQAASIVTSSIQPLHMLSVLKYIEEKIGPEERLSWAQYNIEKGFLALEKLLKDFAGTYATGEEVYMADVFLAPQIAVAIARFNIDMSKFLTLSRIYESYKALPEFQASLPERQPDAGRLENMSSSQPRGKRGKSFSMQEDETLCKAWLTIKQDSVIGGAQRDSCFWNRVSQHFLKNKVGVEPRTVCSIQNRWEKIRLYCAKYRGCLAQIEHRQQSGYVIADWDDQAKGMYLSDIGKPFIYEHCWELLKGSDKWLIVGVPRNRSPQSPVFEGTSVTPISLDLDQDPISHGSVSSPRGKSKRPSSQKAEKEARQKSKASPQESGLLSETIEKISDRHELGKALFEEQKIQIMKEASEMEATKLQLMRAVEERKKAAEDREQMSQDDAIMNLDTSNMSSELQHYYQLRKNAIMAKALNF